MIARVRTRILFLAAAVVGVTLIASAIWTPPEVILYNHTPSVPVGFYIRTETPAARGAFVTVRAVDAAPAAARARRFAGPRDRFIKRVAAIAGDHVCGAGPELFINNVSAATRRLNDSQGAILPAWEECRVLEADELLLLGDTPDSFDGRYWGPITTSKIEGVWRRL